jgi:exopolysaccharide biosynthesis polyprenyl glycosylphosphotransferase
MLLALVDALLTAVALITAVTLRLGWLQGADYLAVHFSGVAIAWGVFILAFYVCGLYESESLQRPGRMLTGAVLAVALGALLVAGVFYATLSLEIGRGIFAGFAGFVFVAVVTNRLLYISANRRGFLAQRCLVIGTNGEARKAIELIEEHRHAGLRVFGLIHCGAERERIGKFVGGYPVLGTLDALEKFIELYDIDRLILAAAQQEEALLLKRLRIFRYRGISIVDFVTLHEELAQEIPLDYINDEWLFLASLNNSQIHIRRLKRLVDVGVAMVGLILTIPLAALAALLIKLTSPGPVLYRQERLGRDSIPFTLLKFRTMVADAEEKTGPVWAAENDPRITGVGKWLRKLRIDEIPQLLNVLRGEMSLVGPRPEREVFIRQLAEKVPFYAERLLVPPGVTGWAQVMAPYAASIEDSRRKLQFDLYYIKHMSFFLDVFVCLKTVKTMLFGRERHAQPQAHAAPKPQPVRLPTETYIFDPSQLPQVESKPPPPHSQQVG